MFIYFVGKLYQDYNGYVQSNFYFVFVIFIINFVIVEVILLCGNNINCLFDFYVIGLRVIVMVMLDFIVDFKDVEDVFILGILQLEFEF